MTDNNATIGTEAIDFTLPTFSDEETISLSDFRGNSNVILYFYPKDNTPGCTTESIEFSGMISDFKKIDTVIIGISKNSSESHCKFRDKYNLSIPLASDTDQVCEKYNCWVEKSMFGKKYMGIERSTFLIDKEGVIQYIWRKVKVKDHVATVFEKTKSLLSQ